MADGSSNVTGVEVDALHSSGRTLAGRAGGGRAAAKNMNDGLDSASKGLGHFAVKDALSNFVTYHVMDDSLLLGNQLEAGGDNVSNVSSTARSSDEEAAHALVADIASNNEIDSRINRQV